MLPLPPRQHARQGTDRQGARGQRLQDRPRTHRRPARHDGADLPLRPRRRRAAADQECAGILRRRTARLFRGQHPTRIVQTVISLQCRNRLHRTLLTAMVQDLSTITAFIDGEPHPFEAGDTLLNFIDRHRGRGHVPTLCDAPQLEPYGACRVCSVEVALQRRWAAPRRRLLPHAARAGDAHLHRVAEDARSCAGTSSNSCSPTTRSTA